MIEAAKKKWYRPRQIAELGLIKNSTGGDNVDSNYNFILDEIKHGRLKAKRYGSRPYFLVSEEEIQRYNSTT